MEMNVDAVNLMKGLFG